MTSVLVAPRVYLCSPGAVFPSLPAGSIVLPAIESRAFGDGSHPTTRLCAQAVDLFCRRERPSAVLDVGTGSGVLARIARAHGAALVVGTDVDPAALAAARANAALDGNGGELILSDKMPDAWGARFALVVANILEGVLLALAPSLVAALAPSGTLILSGFTGVQSPSLRAAFSARGLAVDLQAEQGGWVVLQLRRVS